jgi:hypothetical protein
LMRRLWISDPDGSAYEVDYLEARGSRNIESKSDTWSLYAPFETSKAMAPDLIAQSDVPTPSRLYQRYMKFVVRNTGL